MTNPAMLKNAGAWVTGAFAFVSTPATAGGTGDATEVNGVAIDLLAYGTRYRSAKLVIPVRATLASGATLSIAANFQDGAASNSWSDYATALTNAVHLTGPSGGGAAVGVAELEVDITGARRWLRVQVTPDLSSTGTDTAVMGAGVLLLCGPQEIPAPY